MLARHFTRSFLIICSVLSGSYAALAQGGRFTVAAGAGRIGIKDQVEINYQLQDPGNMSRLDPVPFHDFAIVQGPMPFQQSSVSISGNQTVQTSTLQITFVVRPLRTGKLVIPPATLRDAAGHTIQSAGMTIDVIPGSVVSGQQRRQMNDPFGDQDDAFLNMQRQMAQQQAMLQRMMGAQMQQRQMPGAQQQQMQQPQVTATGTINPKDIFIKVSIDKSNVHVGEQVTALYKLYSRIPMQVAISKLPSLNGFWTQDFEIPRQAKPTDEVISGQHYQVFVLKKSALFPQQSGTLTLDPVEADGTARIIQKSPQRNPFGDAFDNDPFFQQAFGGSLMMNDPMFNGGFFNNVTYKDVPAHLKSTPVNITVSDLPAAGKPAGYGNAVGSFTFQGKLDKSNLSTDDAATYQLTISGTGNIKLIEAPKLALSNGLDTYEPKIIDTITGRTEAITGNKIITYTIAPHSPGDYTIPPVTFSYYNPQTGSYTTLQTASQHLHVTAGAHYKPAAAIALKDIRDNDNGVPTFSPAGKPLIYSPGYWSLYALPLVSFFGFIVWKKRNDEEEQDIVATRSRKANKVALKRLVTAQQYLQQGRQTPFYDEVSKAIWLYLSDKLYLPLAHLSKESATQALNARKVPAATLQQLDVLLQHCELALYAPTGGTQGMQHTYQDAVSLISTLETHL